MEHSRITRLVGLSAVFFSLVVLPWENAHGECKGVALHPCVRGNLDLLEVWVKARMAYADIPGVSIGVVHDQELVYSQGFGYADCETKAPATPETLYRIASHSKLFTAIGIMQLRDLGKLKLDDPVKKHLPDFDIQITYPEAHAVTIRHLLTHSSGLPREAGSAYWIDFNFPRTEQVIERLEKQTTILPTKSRFKYSNLAFALLGEVIARKSNESYRCFVENRIMAPLEMADSTVVLPEEHLGRLAVGYGRRMPDGTKEAFPFIDARGMAAATGVTSSVKDMANFVSWQLRLREQGGKEVISASTLKEMQRPHWVNPDGQVEEGWGLISCTRRTET